MLKPCGLALVILSVWGAARAAEHTVADAVEYRALEKQVKPGDVILLKDGTWTDQSLKVRLKGTAEAPITIRAKSFGSVTLTGGSFLDVEGAYVTVENLIFSGGTPKDDNVVRLAGDHCRLTQSGIFYYNPPKSSTRYFWVSLYGHDHQVDHCAFAGQNHSGVTLVTWLKDENDSGGHHIDHNYFGFRPRGEGNGFETMRIGDSETALKNVKALVESNLFEECDGEIEVISNKSCENIYRGNTFLKCSGCLTLRHGHRCRVENNVILGDHKKGSGGIRVIGEGHVVIGNRVEGTEARADAAISLSAANKNAKPSQHQLVKDVRIEGNFVADNKGACLCFDHGLGDEGMTLLPENVTVINNRFAARGDDEIISKRGSEAATWTENLAKGEKLGVPESEGLKLVKEFPAGPELPQPLTRKEVGPSVDWSNWLKAPN